jgi:hypothetical protein
LPRVPFAGAVTEHELAVHVCAVKVPLVQDVTAPEIVKPELHANWQLLPEERTDGQVPRVPFDGAVTEHGLGTHDCAVNVPFVQDVTAPESAKPTLQEKLQLLPEEREDGQLPRAPFEGGVTVQELPLIILLALLFSARLRGASRATHFHRVSHTRVTEA